MCERCYETYDEFKSRIFSFEKPNFSFGVERFEPSESVKNKVNEEGLFRRFIGDTVVFDLTQDQKQFIRSHYIEPLYYVAGDCLAEKFDESTLHMTLHDLNSSLKDDFDVLKRTFEVEVELAKKLSDTDINPQSIDMVTTCVFNMVNTSLVLGLIPKTEKDYHKLMKLYWFVDDISKLPYPFTPHITLAYYNRNGFEGDRIKPIEKVVNEMNSNSFNITISTSRLYYQKFLNMNEFFNIMRFTK